MKISMFERFLSSIFEEVIANVSWSSTGTKTVFSKSSIECDDKSSCDRISKYFR